MKMYKLETQIGTLYYGVVGGYMRDSDEFGSRVGDGCFMPNVDSEFLEHVPEVTMHVSGIVDLPDNRVRYEELQNAYK